MSNTKFVLCSVCALLLGMSPARAESIYVTGVLEGASAATDAGSTWTLLLQYTPSATAVAAITQASLVVNRVGGGTYTWSALDGSKTNTVSVLTNKNTLRVRTNWTGDQSGLLGTNLSKLTLSIVSPTAVPTEVASAANVSYIMNTATSISGTFEFDPFAPFGDTEQILVGIPQAVPEPGTWALLAAVSGVIGRRVLRNRRILSA